MNYCSHVLIQFSSPVCRSVIAGVEQRQQDQMDAESRELAEKVAVATCQQLKANIMRDMEVMRAYKDTLGTQASEAALDQKYLRERQKNLNPRVV